jgi:hypothetical protein
MEPDNAARVLVAVITHPRDLHIARQHHWYRIPLDRSPAQPGAEYLAFYQTAAFGSERWAVRYYAPILSYRVVTRRELLPEEPRHPHADNHYYRLELGAVEALARPVSAAKLRRITFIFTTFGQLRRARDVRELWHPEEEHHRSGNVQQGIALTARLLKQ